LMGAGGGVFAPAGKVGFLIVTGAMGVAVFGDSMGFCTGLGAGAATAGLMGFTAADVGVCGGVCRFGKGAEDGVWLAEYGTGLVIPSAAAVLGFGKDAAAAGGCWMVVAGCGGCIEGTPVAGAGAVGVE
jgi:hypothetical protein